MKFADTQPRSNCHPERTREGSGWYDTAARCFGVPQHDTLRVVVCLIVAAISVIGCDDKKELPDLRMIQQPRYEPMEPSEFWSDGTSARTPVAGTVPIDGPVNQIQIFPVEATRSKQADFPFPLARGDIDAYRYNDVSMSIDMTPPSRAAKKEAQHAGQDRTHHRRNLGYRPCRVHRVGQGGRHRRRRGPARGRGPGDRPPRPPYGRRGEAGRTSGVLRLRRWWLRIPGLRPRGAPLGAGVVRSAKAPYVARLRHRKLFPRHHFLFHSAKINNCHILFSFSAFFAFFRG